MIKLRIALAAVVALIAAPAGAQLFPVPATQASLPIVGTQLPPRQCWWLASLANAST